ncbi:hypothetical protein EJ05DRAFT_280656 [Pseudovirgaria hyperparasitica]|uniref:Protein Zds1 C-terminal domain-containing protein n=1 Tax=Pseudovirgaria hyperparasitica TaxID=470096 RepID=A0A6A6WCB6_9PEZI|nr:uncharacterized protein EJ05DRAFT_280656 [Pseudovirgaria hyperparasitica]KAF2760353.1 hypothetical protein EJ05DRAFT_280656 [Pseudovirgaria hyperparasitica]
MQTTKTERALELDRLYQARRGHTPQISISDETHHITEAIGDMYGREDDHFRKRDPRPLSFVSSPQGENFESNPSRSQIPRTPSNGAPIRSPLSPTNTRTASTNQDNGHPSPPSLNRTNSDTAQQQFPINDLDYESSPAAVAQELSNLQAIRRMSMDVNKSDPDLPSFGGGISIPPMAPSHETDENDASTLYWVPASLHPELAPKEFKTFIEERVEKMRRRNSGGEDSLSPDGLGRSGSGGGLRRKKSMLSKQINSGTDYKDGADRLERKKSGANQLPNALENISELEHLVNDPSSIVQRTSGDTLRRSNDSGEQPDDMPILPAKLGTPLLKRSIRTNYRRGSLRKGERVGTTPRRPGFRGAETDTEESPVSSPSTTHNPDFPGAPLTRVQTEPLNRRPSAAENFSRPTRKRSPPNQTQPYQTPSTDDKEASGRQQKSFHSRIASNGRTTANLPGYGPQQKVPSIVETPPADTSKSGVQLPARSSSHEIPPHLNSQQPQHTPPPAGPLPARPPLIKQASNANREPPIRDRPPSKPTNQTLEDIISKPTPLPGNLSTRTDTLSSIPYDDKKLEKKPSREGKSGEGSGKKWWSFGGSDDKEKDKEEKDLSKKSSKSKFTKANIDKSHDNTRLDVLQTSIDGSKGRESLVLDRENVKLDEERRKDSNRKASGNESKKEKGGSTFLSSLFGSTKRSEKESGGKRASSSRGISPEPPLRILKPDIDYNWTRFSILEERAIYRMAHIKLANPRRELYSQVLLSNFMYSYLAKVQQMHPQMQIAQSPAQQKQQQQQQQAQQQQAQQQQTQPEQADPQGSQQRRQTQSRQRADQPEEFSQYQRYQEQARLDTSPSTLDTSNHGPLRPDPPSPADDRDQQRSNSRPSRQQEYDRHQNSNGYSVASGDRYMGNHGSSSQQGYYQQDLFDDNDNTKDDEMW